MVAIEKHITSINPAVVVILCTVILELIVIIRAIADVMVVVPSAVTECSCFTPEIWTQVRAVHILNIHICNKWLRCIRRRSNPEKSEPRVNSPERAALDKLHLVQWKKKKNKKQTIYPSLNVKNSIRRITWTRAHSSLSGLEPANGSWRRPEEACPSAWWHWGRLSSAERWIPGPCDEKTRNFRQKSERLYSLVN